MNKTHTLYPFSPSGRNKEEDSTTISLAGSFVQLIMAGLIHRKFNLLLSHLS
jgi:hypothetical protein